MSKKIQFLRRVREAKSSIHNELEQLKSQTVILALLVEVLIEFLPDEPKDINLESHE